MQGRVACTRDRVTLDDDDIEAVATRVVEMLRGENRVCAADLVDAATLARTLDVDRDWVYAHARELGAMRLGEGPKARLRFDLRRVRQQLDSLRDDDRPPPNKSPRRSARRSREQSLPAGAKLIQGRSSR